MKTPPKVRRVIILGAQSAIAEAAARLFARRAARLVLAGRDQGRLNEIADDLIVRGAAQVHTAALDFQAEPAPQRRLHDFVDRLGGGASHVLIAFGDAGDLQSAAADVAEAKRIIDVNFASTAAWALAAANVLEQQRAGTLMTLGCISGDRGRLSDYIHGAAKAGLAVLMQGLAHRLSRSGVRAVLIKAGPTDAPAANLRRADGPLSRPQDIADVIYKAADRGGPILYAPPAWRWRMLAVRATPAFLAHRTR